MVNQYFMFLAREAKKINRFW